MKKQRTGIKKSLHRFYINTALINWNCKLAIPLKHIIFTEPFIADGECLCAFWADKSRVDFIQNASVSLQVYLDNFINKYIQDV